jgi:membrane-associated phospholipid phosphatase
VYAPLTFEALSIAFFAALTVAAPWTPVPRDRRRRAMLVFVALAAVMAASAYALPPSVRVWLGPAYLVAGYRLPALLVSRTPDPGPRVPDPGPFESWLIRTNERWFPFQPAIPRWAAHIVELSYLFCYLLVPAAFVFIWMNASAEDVDRFWTSVLLAGFTCYGLLPWLVSPPPRVRYGDSEPADRLRRLNLHILRRASHGFNTFPSGHVAVSMAAALGVVELSRSAGLAALLLTLGIAAGAAAGRYHYVIDVIAGVLVGTAAWCAQRAL